MSRRAKRSRRRKRTPADEATVFERAASYRWQQPKAPKRRKWISSSDLLDRHM